MKLSKILIGAMRFKDRASAAEIIHKAIDCGFNYIDTSPCYCYKSEKENSEAWVGAALATAGYRERVMVSTKCAPGDGGRGLGPFVASQGFGVRTTAHLAQMFKQSLARLGLPRLDFYHLWTTHTREQFEAAMQPGGWYDGVMEQKQKGMFDHLGITTHADPDTIIAFLETGKFETVTMPLNVIDLTRLKTVDYCAKKGIPVIAMNPLAGGFCAANSRLKELALRYLMALPNVHILIGFSAVNEVDYAKWILDTSPEHKQTAEQILKKVDTLIGAREPRCTACGYCQPCPQGINLGSCLSYYNIYKYMKLPHAKKAFKEKQWEASLKLDKCTACGTCSTRCPNQLPLDRIIADAKKLLYEK
ncbi:MAG TPA: aldo/keto reductase [Chitinivibrionales bacterium]|nr:aldo/keto reductase [Chitinivibrionales bacterium]